MGSHRFTYWWTVNDIHCIYRPSWHKECGTNIGTFRHYQSLHAFNLFNRVVDLSKTPPLPRDSQSPICSSHECLIPQMTYYSPCKLYSNDCLFVGSLIWFQGRYHVLWAVKCLDANVHVCVLALDYITSLRVCFHDRASRQRSARKSLFKIVHSASSQGGLLWVLSWEEPFPNFLSCPISTSLWRCLSTTNQRRERRLRICHSKRLDVVLAA